MSLVGNYSTQFLHNFHPHLLQTLNHGMLAANGAAAAAAAAGAPGGYFASERSPLGKTSVFSAFSPPKYIGISLDQVSWAGVGEIAQSWVTCRLTVVINGMICIFQNLFNGSESFRTDSASPTCTSHESMEGSQDYDAVEKGESPRSNNSQDPRDLRRKLGSIFPIDFSNLHVGKNFLIKKPIWGRSFCPFLIEIFSVFVSIRNFNASLG